MAKTKLDLRHLAIEAILIVFTVSLALALSEWRVQVKRDELTDRVTNSLKSETEKNIDRLKKAITYHDELLTNLRNGTHPMITATIDQLPFDPANDQELVSFIKSQIFSNSGRFIDPIEVIKSDGVRYLRTNERLSSIQIRNDSLFIYGSGNIVLRSAQISNNSWQIAQATNVLIELDYELIDLLGRINTKFEDYESTTEMAISILYSNDGEILSPLEDLYSIEKELLTQYEKVLSNLIKP